MTDLVVKVPDIGDFKDIPVIEIFVKPGDTVKAEDSLVSLESDKAAMDVPSPAAGTVRELKVKIGDKIVEGVVILTLETVGEGTRLTVRESGFEALADDIRDDYYHDNVACWAFELRRLDASLRTSQP